MPDKEFPFVLNTGRLAHQWHTLTKTGKVPALNKLNPGPFVEIHPEDAKALGIFAGALVKVSSRRGFAIYPAKVSTRVQPGNCFAPFHWNDQFGENLAVNAATSEAVDSISFQPEFKFCAVALTKAPMELREEFTPPQKNFLRAFLSEFRTGEARMPNIPVTAPFTQSQRTYLNELLSQISAVSLTPARKQHLLAINCHIETMKIRHLFISPGHNYFGHHGQPAGRHPIIEVPEIECVAGRGVRGDRFFDFKEDYKGQITFLRAGNLTTPFAANFALARQITGGHAA